MVDKNLVIRRIFSVTLGMIIGQVVSVVDPGTIRQSIGIILASLVSGIISIIIVAKS